MNYDALQACFWGVLAAYIIHILDETLMNGGFVEKVRQHWWREYRPMMFFWFNAAFILAMTLSIALYEYLGGSWVILPLFWTFERASHVLFLHLWWTIRYKEYSPGLLSGLLFFILVGFIIHFGPTAGLITKEDFTIGLAAGCIGGLLLALLPTVIMPALHRRPPPTSQSPYNVH